jgi:hypothetical protein
VRQVGRPINKIKQLNMIAFLVAWFVVKVIICVWLIFAIIPLVFAGIGLLVGWIGDLINKK